jgi:hypothetical protein
MVIIWTEPEDSNSTLIQDDDTDIEDETENESLLELAGVSDKSFLYDDEDLQSMEGQE